jgi:hypothetical protein
MSRVASKSGDTGFPNMELPTAILASLIVLAGIHSIFHSPPVAFNSPEVRNLNS